MSPWCPGIFNYHGRYDVPSHRQLECLHDSFFRLTRKKISKLIHDDVIKWKHFPRCWPFVRGIHRPPPQRPVTQGFDVFFDLLLNKRLSKQSRGWWFETPSGSLWRHRNVIAGPLWGKPPVIGGFSAKGRVMRKEFPLSHDDVIKWKHFPRYWPFVRGIHRSPVNSPHKGQWRGALMFYLICVWINGWVNNREAGDFRRYRAHYDVIVMLKSSYLAEC